MVKNAENIEMIITQAIHLLNRVTIQCHNITRVSENLFSTVRTSERGYCLVCTQYKKNCHFDLMFVTSQLKGTVVLNASMNVCY